MSFVGWHREVVRDITWGAIATNLVVFWKWHEKPTSPEARREAARNRGSMHSLRANAEHRMGHSQFMLDNFTLSQRNIDQGRWWTLITSAFSHQDFVHLFCNMSALHQAAEIASLVSLDPLRFSLLALGSALWGSLGDLWDSRQMAKRSPIVTVGLGASGMVQGISVATMLAAPYLLVKSMYLPFHVSNWQFVMGYLAYDMYQLHTQRSQGRHIANWHGSFTGHAAHLGGAAFGAVFYFACMRGRSSYPRPYDPDWFM